ncbi:MAG: hypothetical protein FJ279_16075, partial [Planctomycetes bacterium]|nr:hypothetical protein [Planctomycetota bacterium]
SALAGRRGGIANNHTWVSHSAPLLGALTQLYESPEAREWLDTEIVCWRDKILPASLGRDGEYVDGAGGWLDYCLQNAIPAFVALKRNGGPDLFRAPGTHLDRVADFLMRANYWLADDARLPHYPLRYALLALASAYRDSAAQWCALANGLTVANAIKAPTYKGMERERSVPYEANRWTRVRMEWRVDTGRFKTSIDGEAVEDLPMLDRAFASVDRVTFAGHWKTQGDVEIRGIAVMDIGSGRNLDWPRLSALQVGPLQAAENLEVSTPDEAAAEIAEDAGHRVLRLRDVSPKTYPVVSFAFAPTKRGAVEFELRKSDNDKSYAYARLWDGEKELRGVIFYTNGMILKHMPDYKNQDWPFGWRPEASHWFSAVWEFLFYDDSVPARRPERGVPSNVFRDLGWVTMRDTWDAQGMQVFFRSGPEMGKDHGDNNAFRLRAFGEDLLPELATPPSGEKELTQKQYDLLGWFEGTEAHNTIVVDGQTQPAVWGDQTGRQYNAQWLAAPGEGIIPRGKLLSTLFSPFYDYASGDAWNAYTRRQVLLDRFRRDLMFVKSDYVVVFDDIRTKDAVPRALEWRMHTRSAASIEGNRMLVQGSKAALWATVVAPSVAALSIAQTPAPIEKHRTPYFVLRPREKAPLANFLVVLQPVRERNAPPSDAQAIPADGGVGVQIKAGSQTDTALFATADSASAENIRLTGAAAWVRRGDAGPVAYALHRGTRLDVAGAPLVESTAKLDASVRLEARGASACINLAEPAEVKLLTGKEATKVSVNGKPIAARLDASLRVESLRPDGEGILVLRLEPGTYQVVLQ